MPELPEVETMVRGIRPVVEGRTILAVRRCRCTRKPIECTPSFATIARRMKDQTVVAVRRLAKRIVLELSTADSLVIEPRMTGLMLLADPPTKEHLRIRWDFDGDPPAAFPRPQGTGASVWFWDRRGLGTVRLYRPAEFAAAFGPDRLGIDALLLTVSDWSELCRRKKQAIKVAMLDQKWIAGIGNLYASEILHVARISPALPANELKPRQIRRVARATHDILHDAIRHEGSTLSDATYRNALNQNGRYQNCHRVYGRPGHPCPTCGTPIERIIQAQRSTFFCPRCQ